jgi:hypothetical protein
MMSPTKNAVLIGGGPSLTDFTTSRTAGRSVGMWRQVGSSIACEWEFEEGKEIIDFVMHDLVLAVFSCRPYVNGSGELCRTP